MALAGAGKRRANGMGSARDGRPLPVGSAGSRVRLWPGARRAAAFTSLSQAGDDPGGE